MARSTMCPTGGCEWHDRRVSYHPTRAPWDPVALFCEGHGPAHSDGAELGPGVADACTVAAAGLVARDHLAVVWLWLPAMGGLQPLVWPMTVLDREDRWEQ